MNGIFHDGMTKLTETSVDFSEVILTGINGKSFCWNQEHCRAPWLTYCHWPLLRNYWPQPSPLCPSQCTSHVGVTQYNPVGDDVRWLPDGTSRCFVTLSSNQAQRISWGWHLQLPASYGVRCYLVEQKMEQATNCVYIPLNRRSHINHKSLNE